MPEQLQAGRLKLNKRCNLVFGFFVVFAVVLIVRLFILQVLDYDRYQSNTVDQYTKTNTIVAKRGTIYDRNMKVLAISTPVERVFISPNTIPNMTVAEYVETLVEDISDTKDQSDERTRLLGLFENAGVTVKEDIANELSTSLGVTKELVLEKAAKEKRADETIKKQVELEVTAKIKKMVADKHYGAFIHFSEETKRYYPYGSLASHIIGFTGTDGYGLTGVEVYYNTLLSGENGKVISAKDGLGNDMSTKYESYIDAVDGTDIMLTVDWTCQSILEKYLNEALEDSGARNRVCGIIMDVNSGDILGMSTKPDFDLNDPYTLDAISQSLADAFEGTEEEKSKYKVELLNELWKNKGVTELYEPGSTFKIITSAMAMEENVVSATEIFKCTGHISIPGLQQPIHCHKRQGHGELTFEGALGYSCNPFFVTMSQRLGKDRFYKYYKAFGYNETTEVDIYGEARNLFFNLDTYSGVDAACAAFGQNFKVTPISHLRAICAVANGGYLVTPHVLKASLDEDGNVVENYGTETKRQVISTENCRVIWDYLYRSVSEAGGNKNAAVPGYKIAAKTGTSTKTEKSQDGNKYYVASCVAFAPADRPEVAVIVIVDEPVGSYYGSTVAAPYVAKIMSEVLPYLGVEPEYTDDDKASLGNAISDYTGKTLTTASNNLQALHLQVKIVGSGSHVVAQSPAAGTMLSENSTVYLFTEEGLNTPTCTVPNVVGLSAAAANREIINAGLNIDIATGTLESVEGATAVKQSITPGQAVLPGTVIVVDFRHLTGVTD
ncbi:MAG: PASTA domain-containing protein [Ruminococcaceae bacterium]|nr:PASTA domain-containing protein [Oscillospiraceae bacterium]